MLKMYITAYTVTVYSEYLPDKADDCVNDADKPVVAVTEASAIACNIIVITSVTLAVTVAIGVTALRNHVEVYVTAVYTLNVVFIAVLLAGCSLIRLCYPSMTELIDSGLDVVIASCTLFDNITVLGSKA